MITVAQAHETEKKVMREVYCETLQRMAEEDGRVVVRCRFPGSSRSVFLTAACRKATW